MSEENITEVLDSSNSVNEAVVKEAESQGWVPKERFRGNEDDWVDAETFVKRGREILPILRKNNENLLRDLNATKEQLKEFREAAEEFKKFQKEAYDRKVVEYESRIAELKESRAQAIADGDGQRVNALDDALDQAKDAMKEAKQAATNVAKSKVEEETPPSNIDPSLQRWLDNNSWFGQDRRMTSIVNGIGESLRLEFPNLKGQDFLDKLDQVLVEEFPDKFGKGKKQRPVSPVESGAGRGSSTGSRGRSYDNLPADAKAACDKFVKQKLMTREEYLANYEWE